MKRRVSIVGVFLASFCWGIHGRLCCSVVPSFILSSGTTTHSRLDPSIKKWRVRANDHYRKDITTTCAATIASSAYKHPRKFSMVTCHMNKSKMPGNFDSQKEDDETAAEVEQSTSKRGVFRRMREKISSTFGGKKEVQGENQNNDGDNGGDVAQGYKPNPLDTIRLRLAMAMSNLNLFQRNRGDEWVVACPKTRVGPGQIVPCVVNGLDIIIFASRDGQRLDAFANACPHLGSPFDLATIERKPVADDDRRGDKCVDCIVCPVHQTAFEIESGKVRGEWCPYPPILGGIMGYVKPKTDLVKFAVRLRGKNVEVRIATSVEDVGKGDEKADGIKGMK